MQEKGTQTSLDASQSIKLTFLAIYGIINQKS